ncbi:MAG TPA: hypothetical protein VKQ27_04985 [Acetobacteraceae bacterium]|nr:hypothetical protein [Acetobacteraceae bacterium]
MLVTLPVRKARPSDRDTILKICVQNHEENGQFSLDAKKVEAMVDRAFSNQGAVIGVVGRDRIEGIIMMLIAQFWYTQDWCLEEIMNFVLPDYRRTTHAKDMITFAKRCSEEIGIPLVIGVVSNERTKAKIELYRRQLGDPVGGYFIHRPGLASPGATV